MRVQLKGIAEAGIHPAHDRVDALQSSDRTEEDLAISRRQISTLNERVAQEARQVGVLEVGLVGGTRGQENDARLLAPGRGRREPRERGLEVTEESVEPLHLRPVKRLGQGGADDHPVLQRIAESGGSIQPVLQHPPLSVRRPGDVGRIVVQEHAGLVPKSEAGPQEMRVRHCELGRQRPIAQEFLGAVEVRGERVVQARPLPEPVAQHLPVVAAHQVRHDIERPGLGFRTVSRIDIHADVLLQDGAGAGIGCGPQGRG